MPITSMTDEKENDNFIRALVVGPNGSGKTLLAASFPGPTLIVDVDKRNKPIRDWYHYRLQDFDVLNINPYNLFTEWQPMLNSLMDNCKYNTIVIDGLTSMSNLLVVCQMINKGLFIDWSKASDKEIKAGPGKVNKGGIAVPSWDEFNGEVMLFSGMLEALKAVKANFFLTAHPLNRTIIKADGASKYESLVTFGPKLESMVPGYFDEIWYTKIIQDWDQKQGKEVTKRVLYTRPSNEFPMAKTAIRKLPPMIDFTNNGAHEGMNFYDKVKEFLYTPSPVTETTTV